MADYSICSGPDGELIPLVHFDNAHPHCGGKLAVSLTENEAMFTTPAYPFDLNVTPIVLSRDDRIELGQLLLKGLDDV